MSVAITSFFFFMIPFEEGTNSADIHPLMGKQLEPEKSLVLWVWAVSVTGVRENTVRTEFQSVVINH